MRKSEIDWRIGGRVAQSRLSQGLSQRRLAKAIGVTVTTVQHYEHHRVEIPLHRLQQIARVLGLAIGTLMPGDDDNIKKAPAVRPGPERAKEGLEC